MLLYQGFVWLRCCRADPGAPGSVKRLTEEESRRSPRTRRSWRLGALRSPAALIRPSWKGRAIRRFGFLVGMESRGGDGSLRAAVALDTANWCIPKEMSPAPLGPLLSRLPPSSGSSTSELTSSRSVLDLLLLSFLYQSGKTLLRSPSISTFHWPIFPADTKPPELVAGQGGGCSQQRRPPPPRRLGQEESSGIAFALPRKVFILRYSSFFISFGCVLVNLKQIKMQFLPSSSKPPPKAWLLENRQISLKSFKVNSFLALLQAAFKLIFLFFPPFPLCFLL